MAGLTLPLSLSLAMFRLSAEESILFPDLELEYLAVAPQVCSLLSFLNKTWLSVVGISTLTSVIFRYLLGVESEAHMCQDLEEGRDEDSKPRAALPGEIPEGHHESYIAWRGRKSKSFAIIYSISSNFKIKTRCQRKMSSDIMIKWW